MDSPAPAPWPFKILFIGVNINEEATLNLKEEHKIIVSALDKNFAGSAQDRPFVKHIPYSTWSEVMEEIKREHPAGLHFGLHSDKEKGIELYRKTVQPEQMAAGIKAWNEDARDKGRTEVRYIAFNSCGSAEHARKLLECVDFAIGHRAPVQDEDALAFSAAFYNHFFDGMALSGSFDIAKSTSSAGYRLHARKDPRAFRLQRREFAEPDFGGAGQQAAAGKRPVGDDDSVLPGAKRQRQDLGGDGGVVEEVNVKHMEPGQFTGRGAEMSSLQRWLAAAESRRVAIVGQGGSGKSTLAQWFLNRVKAGGCVSGARLVFCLQGADMMRGYRDLLQRLKTVLGRSEPDPDKDEDVRSRVHAFLRDAGVANKWVCVLDDLPDPTDLGGLRWLIADAGSSFPWGYGKTVVTSRSYAWTDHLGSADSFVLGCLPEAEAHELLTSRVQQWR
ncbi:MAG: NB-ARC domain-containing protein, partial [Promethearchaeia archaeon]